mmetsp:Transcript_80158/g.259705  ORF Transcript_80158/g.259705 Transcript_80158/m.259705 type:complete len:341 (-) Transcript_80158:241-1263(-)
MNCRQAFPCSPRWLKKLSCTGWAPRAPCNVARGREHKKRKRISRSIFFGAKWLCLPRRCASGTATHKPTKRHATPTSMNGKICGKCSKTCTSVLLPSMLNKMMLPNTQMPAKNPSTLCSTVGFATSEKELPMAMTNKSGSKSLLSGPKPFGTTSARPKPPKPRPKTSKKASTADPVKILFLRTVIFEVWESTQPAPAPTKPPAATVATRRTTTSITSNTGLSCPSVKLLDTLERKLKKDNARVASSGAHVNVTLGKAWSGYAALNSFILGMTKPSPKGNRTQPNTSPSRMPTSCVNIARPAIPAISTSPGKREMSRMAGLNLLMLTSNPAFSNTSKKAKR